MFWFFVKVIKLKKFRRSFDKQRYQDFIATIPNINLDAALAFLGDKYLYWYQEDGPRQSCFPIRN